MLQRQVSDADRRVEEFERKKLEYELVSIGVAPSSGAGLSPAGKSFKDLEVRVLPWGSHFNKVGMLGQNER